MSTGSLEEVIVFPTEGAYIRDAETGRITSLKVGSVHQQRFWKVIDVSVFFRAKGRSKLQDAPTYFYTSPEAYEKVQRVTVNADLKQKWHDRLHQYLAR